MVKKLVITYSLLAIIIVNLLFPVLVQAKRIEYSNQLGTNMALGSPLLNSNFNYEDWNKWEVMTFGVFLSNFTNPLVDSYKTAFTVNNAGSAGDGREALQFGTGNDSGAKGALESLLKYAVPAQGAGYKEIKAKYKYIEGGKVTDIGSHAATIEDLLLKDEGRSSGLTSGNAADKVKSGPILGMTKEFSISGYSTTYPENMALCDLVVAGDSANQDEVIFSWMNGWDIQMMSAWISKVSRGDYAKQAAANLKKMRKEKSKLVMDNFGNICALLDNELIVIYPSAANCHIYKNNKYNLLNSLVFSDAYSGSSSDAMIKGVETKIKSGNSRLKSNSGVQNGDLIVYFDSDTNISKYIKDNIGKDTSNDSLNYGRELVKLLNATLDGDTKHNEMGFRVSVVGIEDGFNKFFGGDKEIVNLAKSLASSTGYLSAFYGVAPEADTLTSIDTMSGESLPLFGSNVYVPVNNWVDKGERVGADTSNRYFVNDTFKYLDGTRAASSGKFGMASPLQYKNRLMALTTLQDVENFMWYSNVDVGANNVIGGDMSVFWKNSIYSNMGKLYKVTSDKYNALNILGGNIKFKDLNNIETVTGKDIKGIDGNADRKRASVDRILKIYTQNSTMKNAMNTLSVKEGTEFAVWTPYIYLTYLRWFGVVGGTDHNFNTHLFKESSDLLNVNVEEMFKGIFLTKEEKEAEVLEYTYMMLHPTDGRKYRANILISWIGDWLYDTYQSIVYGNSMNTYSEDGKLGTRTSSGFFHTDSYSENFMTSWFINSYAKYAIIAMGVFAFFIVVLGILNQKSIAWFLVSLVLAVNVVLVVPALGEITPYVANNVVQGMFNSKLTYWAMAESIENAKLEKEATKDDSSVTGGLTTADYVRMLNITYLDRSIMIKSDISKKVTEDSNGILADIQQLQTTRWLLPTIMRQFDDANGSKDFVYQPIGDIFDNISNMYWVYKPEDKANVITRTSNIKSDVEAPATDISSKIRRYAGYKDTSMESTKSIVVENSNNGQNVANSNESNEYMGYTWNSVSRVKDDEDLPHTGFYMLDYTSDRGTITIPDAQGDWENLVENHGLSTEEFIGLTDSLVQDASTYKPLSEGAKVNHGYLWTTENPMHYFYQVVKDTFGSDRTMAGLSSDLQGVYKESTTTGEMERQSFMHYRDSGDVRDILDLEELFTNVIPYMYTVQLVAGGTNGTNGILGDTKLSNYELYKDNYKSWLYRSNWVSKLMEDRDLTKPTKVKTPSGEKVIVENPLLPSCYPEDRPMIFSEAQQNHYGLTDVDLTLPELRAVGVNKAVERKWTLLINYLNVPEVTTEVFYRQMALDSLIEFNKGFSPDRVINGSKALYPNSLDLRSISFDSLMKMLMINSTKDSSYIYGDTMRGVVENSDIISAILLLVSAFFGAYLLPYVRDIVLGIIFFVGLWSFICNVLTSKMMKVKIAAGFVISNTIFLILTIMYYSVYAMFVNNSTADSVLSIGNIDINAGPPTWQFLMIIITSVLYIWLSFLLIRFVVVSYNDMGFEKYASLATALVGKVKSVVGGVAGEYGKVRSYIVSDRSNNTSSNTVNNIGVMGKESSDTGYNDSATDSIKDSDDIRSSKSGYMNDKKSKSVDVADSDYFDKEIEKGKSMGNRDSTESSKGDIDG